MNRHVMALAMLAMVLTVGVGCTTAGVTTTTAHTPDMMTPKQPTPDPDPSPAPVVDPDPPDTKPLPPDDGDDAGALTIVENICSQCHGLRYADGTVIVKGRGIINPALKDVMQTVAPRPNWRAVVLRMRDANGCTMTEDESEAIIGWLESQKS